MIIPAGIAITQRFFECLDYLVASKTIRGIKTFTTLYNINRGNLYTIRKNPDKYNLNPVYIYYLCKEYNISETYIILGVGSMLKNNDKAQNKLGTRQTNRRRL